jgi:hypothetical protein
MRSKLLPLVCSREMVLRGLPVRRANISETLWFPLWDLSGILGRRPLGRRDDYPNNPTAAFAGKGSYKIDRRTQMRTCTDRVIGDILSSWRYDISGITPEMRRDYEQHLIECDYCRSRQRLHRNIDVFLIGLSTLSIGAFLLALAVIHHVAGLQHWAVDLHLWQMSFALSLQAAAITGLLISLLLWVLVVVATPVPFYLTGVALMQARVLQARIPEELRERLMRNVA